MSFINLLHSYERRNEQRTDSRHSLAKKKKKKVQTNSSSFPPSAEEKLMDAKMKSSLHTRPLEPKQTS